MWILTLEQLAAQRVDALALLVHHVVVLEQVLADVEVLRLDLLLRALDRVGDHLVLDRHAFFHPEALHQPGDAVGAEDAHQVVFERQVEPRRARVALAAGAAAKLVVDAARFVPLGADDVQAAERDDLVVLGVGLRLEALRRCARTPAAARGRSCRGGRSRRTRSSSTNFSSPLGSLSAISSASVCCRAMNSGLPPRRMSVPRPAMLVAIVTAPLRPAWATISASCSWYFAFRTTCLMPRRFRSLDSRSDFSIETVPTSTGRPRLLLLDDVVDDRVELLALGPVDHVRLFDARSIGRLVGTTMTSSL